MPKNKPKQSKKEDENFSLDKEIIIGLNSKKEKDNPQKKNKKKKKTKSSKKKIQKVQNAIPKKKKKKKSKLKKVFKALLKIGIILTIGTCIVLFLFVSPVFSIQEITVIGAEKISESVYIATSGIEEGSNIFRINKTEAMVEIKKDPYVESIKINSVYPNKIEIEIVEREISYIAEQNGKYSYLDKNGYILETSLAPIDMTIIKGCKTNLETKELRFKNRGS